MPLRVLLVGAGRWARNIARCLARIGEAKLVAVADTRLELARELASLYGAEAYGDAVEAAERSGAEAAVVAVTPSRLRVVARSLLELGLHVLVEKPVSFRAGGAEELARIAESRGLVAVPGFIMRFNPAVQEARREAAGEALELYSARMSARPEHMKSVPILLDLAVHDVDLARWILGEELRVASAYAERRPCGDEVAYIALRGSKSTALLQVSGCSPVKVRRLTVVAGDRVVDADTDALTVSVRSTWGYGKSYKLEAAVEPLEAELRAFIDRVEGRDTPYTRVQASMRDAVEALRIIEEAARIAGYQLPGDEE